MPDSCDCINIKVNVSLKEPKLNGKLDPKCETILCSDGQDYKRGYEEGHTQGLIDGRADGYESGYKEGHKVGSETGYQTGKNEGLTEGYGNGYAQGNAVGYKAGYDEGYSKGYSEGYSQGLADGTKEEQEKYVKITENGTTEILPDENKVLSKVTVDVNVESGGNGLPYDMGEFVLDADKPNDPTVGIPHKLGVRPKFVCIWTDDFAELSADNLSPYSKFTSIGYIWLDGLTGMQQRLTASINNDRGIFIGSSLPPNGYAVSYLTPSSKSYVIQEGYCIPTEEKLFLVYLGNNCYWRAGVTYKYFVSENWWDIKEVLNAE